MVAERPVPNSWLARLVDVACRAGSTLDETREEVDIQTLHFGIYMVLQILDGDKSKLLV